MKNENQPTAHITVEKKRIKQYDDIVYLSDQKEFEVELHNPTQGKILAKIEINGNAIGGNGIIIRPGERVFLERYLNEAKKFLFETYKVNGENSQVKKAIEKNGNISVKFYQEYVAPPINFGSLTIGNSDWNNGIKYFNSGTVTTTTNPFTTNTPLFTTGTNMNTSTYTSNGNSTFTSQVFNTTSTNNVNTDSLGDKLRSRTLFKSKMKKLTLDEPKEIETGRIEKGSNSNQNFTYDYSQFNTWHNWKSEWKILPLSQKPLVIEDIKVFCVNCGKRRKNNKDKYCSSCGSKY